MFTFASMLSFTLKFKGFGSQLNPRPLANFGLFVVLGTGVFYLSQSLAHNLVEPYFVQNNKRLELLAAKYKFTIYDFAQAKKEGHLKRLKDQFLVDMEVGTLDNASF